MTTIHFKNARVFDGFERRDTADGSIITEDGVIREVSDSAVSFPADIVVDVAGRTVMPGLIDAHVHIWFARIDIPSIARLRTEYIAGFAFDSLRKSLHRGFTTIRDAGGTDVGYAHAVRDGLVEGSRLYHTGRILSQTGGHGDFRLPGEFICSCMACSTAGQDRFTVLVNGVDEVRAAVREELRKGAHQIKIMGSGGVGTPADPLDNVQFSDEEILTAVAEAKRHGAYTMAHCHPAKAIKRCAELGVRSIEHGSLVDVEAARAVVANGAYIVPTLSVVAALNEDGAELGFPAVSVQKLKKVYANLLSGLEIMRSEGVRIGFGTDLIGPHQDRQCTEFTLRREVQPAIDILRSATSINAEIMQLGGELGCLAPGAFADLLVVDGDPVEDIGLLGRNGDALSVILQNGRFIRKQI